MGCIVTQDDMDCCVDKPEIPPDDEEDDTYYWETDRDFGSNYDPNDDYTNNNGWATGFVEWHNKTNRGQHFSFKHE